MEPGWLRQHKVVTWVQAWEPDSLGSNSSSATHQQHNLGASDSASVFQFPHLSNRGNNNTYVMGLI